MKVKVCNMTSEGSGRDIANQFIINIGEVEYFQSYRSIIAKTDESGLVYLDKDKWNYSSTTSRYRNQFLGETTKETEAKIKSGEYILANLNE